MPERIFKVAKHFERSCALLYKDVTATLHAMKPGETGDLTSLIPAVVLEAFALELYLKCLHLVEQNKLATRTHSLLKLYQIQTDQSRQEIRKDYEAISARNPITAAMKSKLPHISTDFDDVLAQIDQAFEQWRYSFEGNATSSFGIGELITAVRTRIRKVRPDLI